MQLGARVVDVDTPDVPGSGLHHHWQLTPPRGSHATLDNHAAAPRFVADLCGGHLLQHFVDDGVTGTAIEERWLYAGFARGHDRENVATCAARPCSADTTDEFSFTADIDADVDADDSNSGVMAVQLIAVRRSCSSTGALPFGFVMVTLLVRRRSRRR